MTSRTRHAITHVMHAFSDHRDRWNRLRGGTPPRCTSGAPPPEMELRGTRIREGDKVVAQFVFGNFDEEVFPKPERFDVGRDPPSPASERASRPVIEIGTCEGPVGSRGRSGNVAKPPIARERKRRQRPSGSQSVDWIQALRVLHSAEHVRSEFGPSGWVVAEPRSVAIVVALITTAGVIGAAYITRGDGNGGGGSNGGGGDGINGPTIDRPGSASVFLSRDSGPGGTTVQVSGEGFAPTERVVISFHTEEIGSTTANGEGRFSNVAVAIPESFSQFAPAQFDVIAHGETSLQTATAPFTISG